VDVTSSVIGSVTVTNVVVASLAVLGLEVVIVAHPLREKSEYREHAAVASRKDVAETDGPVELLTEIVVTGEDAAALVADASPLLFDRIVGMGTELAEEKSGVLVESVRGLAGYTVV